MSSVKHLYSKLSEEEISDPWLVIHGFFDYSGIDSVKENMWEWLKITVSGTFSSDMLSKGRRYDMIYLYEHVEKLIEAVHILYKQNRESKKNKATKEKIPAN